MTEAQRREWHQNKWTIIALMITVGTIVASSVAQTVWLGYQAGQFESRVAILERDSAAAIPDRARDRAEGARRDQAIVRLETQFSNINVSIRDLAAAMKTVGDKLDRLIERDRDKP